MNFSLLVLEHKYITEYDDMSKNRHITRERIAVSHLKAETYVQKVIFSSFKISILIFKFIADIDEISPSEDEAAAQRALHGVGGGDFHTYEAPEQAYHQREDSRQPSQRRDLRPEGYIFIFSNLFNYIQAHCRH